MTLQERVSHELKAAMLAKDAARLSTLRLLKSALGYVMIEKKSETLPDAEVSSIIQKEIKKRRDSVEQYQAAGRTEQAAAESAEILVLEAFLPKPLSPEELEALVKTVIQETGATSKKDMGTVVRTVQTRSAGRADGKSISLLVGKLLP
ncbi:MAG: GatB/YqeY domain-containing protein [Verrucomicrobia bacterium]|nr:GatB/YqeY domain-containing protein [Verrucomicrobiota bacterium]